MKATTPDDKPQSTGAKILKGMGIVTALISLILGGNQVYKIVKENQQKKELDNKIVLLIKDSQTQTGLEDYNGAWKTLLQAHELNPDSREVENEQLQVALKWIQVTAFKRTGSEKSFSEVVDPLMPILNHQLTTAETKMAATILAHIGWANFLKWYDNITDLKTEELFQKALEKDSMNVYAHSFYAYWLIKNGNHLNEAKSHFEKAISSGNEKPFVRQIQYHAYQLYQNDKLEIELIRMANEMRINSEELSLNNRQRIVDHFYNGYGFEVFDSINTLFSASENLALFNFLTAQTDYTDHPLILLKHAILLENAGDKTAALSIYKALQKETGFVKMNMVDAAIKRIEAKK